MQYTSSRVRVSVPATSANLGPGFDSMGLALEVRDEITVEAVASSEVSISIYGEGEGTLPRDERHLIVRALRQTQEILGLPQTGLHMEAHNRVPQSRGMGSSASAIVAGVSAAVAFSGRTDLGKDFIFNVAAQMEGHPDNVAPAVYGGLTVSWNFEAATDIPLSVLDAQSGGAAASISTVRREYPEVINGFSDGFHTVTYPVDGAIHVYMFIPEAKLSTKTARTVLPAKVSYEDAVRNIARAAVLPSALGSAPSPETNAILLSATEDRLHQDYRKDLMPDSWQLMTHLRSRGYAAVISGAGPCVLVFHSSAADDQIREVTQQEWISTGRWKMLPVKIDSRGVVISKEEKL